MMLQGALWRGRTPRSGREQLRTSQIPTPSLPWSTVIGPYHLTAPSLRDQWNHELHQKYMYLLFWFNYCLLSRQIRGRWLFAGPSLVLLPQVLLWAAGRIRRSRWTSYLTQMAFSTFWCYRGILPATGTLRAVRHCHPQGSNHCIFSFLHCTIPL